MKKFLPLSLTLCGAAGLIAVAVHAANPPASAPAAPTAEKSPARPVDRLGLSAEQKARLQSLREQMKAVLTPEQREQMAAMHNQFARGAGGPQRFGRGPAGPGNFGRGPGFDRPGPQRLGHHRPGAPRFGHRAAAWQMRQHAVRGHLMKMQHQRERRAEMLGLTDEQRAKMRQIAFQHREKAIGLRQDLRAEMESVLTPEQKAMLKERKARPGRGPAPAQAGPPPGR